MEIALTEEQALLKDSADRFIANEYGFDARQKLAASDDGFSRKHWASFAELGWLAMPLPEAHGGLGGGGVETAVLMEAFGRGLVLEPYLATVVLGAGLVADAGNAGQKDDILPAVAEGRMLLALAHGERQARYDLFDVAAVAEKKGGGYHLSGDKAVVWHGGAADRLIVSARTAGKPRDAEGITLFLVDPKAKGVAVRAYPTNDGQRAAEIRLDGVAVDADDVLGPVGGALPLLESAFDRALIAASAEAVGAMEALVAQTQEYLKTRKQFGVPLSKFQVLQHRLVEMYNEHQTARALVYRAAAALNGSDARTRAPAAAAARAYCAKAAKFVAEGAVQLHGGMGMTWELPVGHYFKRIAMIDALLGGAEHHRERFAEMG